MGLYDLTCNLSFPGLGIIIILAIFHESGQCPILRAALKMCWIKHFALIGSSFIIFPEIRSCPGALLDLISFILWSTAIRENLIVLVLTWLEFEIVCVGRFVWFLLGVNVFLRCSANAVAFSLSSISQLPSSALSGVSAAIGLFIFLVTFQSEQSESAVGLNSCRNSCIFWFLSFIRHSFNSLVRRFSIVFAVGDLLACHSLLAIRLFLRRLRISFICSWLLVWA